MGKKYQQKKIRTMLNQNQRNQGKKMVVRRKQKKLMVKGTQI